MKVSGIDHIVLTVASIPGTCEFYQRALGMESIEFGDNRVALAFGRHKINLHQAGLEFEPKADNPTPGSADICLVTDSPIDQIVEHLERNEIEIEQGPVPRSGAIGTMLSCYIRDPDNNLVEIATYAGPRSGD